MALCRLRLELDAELRLAAGPVDEEHELAGDLESCRRPVVLLDERQRQVHAGRDAGRRVRGPVLHVDAIGVDLHGGEQVGEQFGH